MKVILKDDLEDLGTAGDVVEVADGYGRNYLLARNLAVPATKGNLKSIAEIRKQKQFRDNKRKREAERFKDRLEKLSLTAEVQTGEEDKNIKITHVVHHKNRGHVFWNPLKPFRTHLDPADLENHLSPRDGKFEMNESGAGAKKRQNDAPSTQENRIDGNEKVEKNESEHNLLIVFYLPKISLDILFCKKYIHFYVI